jgi:hypothetical protein
MYTYLFIYNLRYLFHNYILYLNFRFGILIIRNIKLTEDINLHTASDVGSFFVIRYINLLKPNNSFTYHHV